MTASRSPATSLIDVDGVGVGHYTDNDGLTGCTVVLCPAGAVAAIDSAGGAPGSRETDLLGPGRLVQSVHAVLLAGGSAFGLDAASGVMRYLAERGHGFRAGNAIVPIVPAAVLFDLGVGDGNAFPDATAGYQACLAAQFRGSGSPTPSTPAEGSVGAGTGATVGKALGIHCAMKGGVGTAALRLATGHVVGAIVAVNAFGDVVHPLSGQAIAGPRDVASGKIVSTTTLLLNRTIPPAGSAALGQATGQNTTIGVVATDAQLTRDQLARIARMAHDGLARTIRPAHTLFDGDTIFALATGRVRETSDPTAVGAAAAEVVATAIVRAVFRANEIGGGC